MIQQITTTKTIIDGVEVNTTQTDRLIFPEKIVIAPKLSDDKTQIIDAEIIYQWEQGREVVSMSNLSSIGIDPTAADQGLRSLFDAIVKQKLTQDKDKN